MKNLPIIGLLVLGLIGCAGTNQPTQVGQSNLTTGSEGPAPIPESEPSYRVEKALDGIEREISIPHTSLRRLEEAGEVAGTNHLIVMNPMAGSGPGGGLTPNQVNHFYGNATSASHDAIAVVTAFNYPTALKDFNTFSLYFGLASETSTNPTASTNKVFQVVYATGSKPADHAAWSQEAALDIQWTHAMAPKAKIYLVQANSASISDMYKAVDIAAMLPGVKQISMSWGTGETATQASIGDPHFKKSGITYFAASGDAGGVVNYPATSQYVVAVGGTTLNTDKHGNFSSETTWTNSGGGNSAYVAKPSWQNSIPLAGARRGTPDIACVGNPATGVSVYVSTPSNGLSGWLVFGGTSVSTPIIAGLTNSSGMTFTSSTQLLITLYSNYLVNRNTYFRDITSGTSGSNTAKSGWDYCSGVGAPLSPKSL